MKRHCESRRHILSIKGLLINQPTIHETLSSHKETFKFKRSGDLC